MMPTPHMPSGIPTNHAGTRFRSRLEARWAHYFDQLGWRWEYEPFDMDGYIPDFLIFGEMPLLVEVKPISSYAEAEKVVDQIPLHPDYEQLAVGVAPNLTGKGECYGWGTRGDDAGIFGCLNEHGDEDGQRWPQPAYLVWCIGACDGGAPACNGSWGIVPDCGSYAYRPCSHHHGGSPNIVPEDYHPDWASSRNATQWNAR